MAASAGSVYSNRQTDTDNQKTGEHHRECQRRSRASARPGSGRSLGNARIARRAARDPGRVQRYFHHAQGKQGTQLAPVAGGGQVPSGGPRPRPAHHGRGIPQRLAGGEKRPAPLSHRPAQGGCGSDHPGDELRVRRTARHRRRGKPPRPGGGGLRSALQTGLAGASQAGAGRPRPGGGVRQPGATAPLPHRVLQPEPLDRRRRPQRRPGAVRHYQLRAAAGSGQGPPGRRRPAHRQYRRLDSAVRVFPARQ